MTKNRPIRKYRELGYVGYRHPYPDWMYYVDPVALNIAFIYNLGRVVAALDRYSCSVVALFHGFAQKFGEVCSE